MILCAIKSKHRHAYTYIQRTIDIKKLVHLDLLEKKHKRKL